MMDTNEFRAQFKQTLDDMNAIMIKKNTDYAGIGDPFKNFRVTEQLGIATADRAILIRICDKLARISNLLDKDAMVDDETVIDTCIDAANYFIILSIFLANRDK